MNEKQFCLLCAKYKNNLQRIEFGPVQVDVCEDCNKVVFNLNRIISETKRKILESKIDPQAKVLIKSVMENHKDEETN